MFQNFSEMRAVYFRPKLGNAAETIPNLLLIANTLPHMYGKPWTSIALKFKIEIVLRLLALATWCSHIYQLSREVLHWFPRIFPNPSQGSNDTKFRRKTSTLTYFTFSLLDICSDECWLFPRLEWKDSGMICCRHKTFPAKLFQSEVLWKPNIVPFITFDTFMKIQAIKAIEQFIFYFY